MSTNFEDYARTHLLDSARTAEQAAACCVDDICRAARLLSEAFAAGGKLLLCGNGGSAADCQHMAAELVSCLTLGVRRRALPAVALTTDTSILTAYSNDFGIDGVFARQVQALGRPGDVLLAISTSGQSRNVLNAVGEAKERGVRVIALTGEGGELAGAADVAIRVPAATTPHMQEAHLAIEHILCALVEQDVLARGEGPDSGTIGP